jgi:hypothetical protein
MAVKLRGDVSKALADWKAGKAVRGLELGHVHRMKENPGMSPMIDSSERFNPDQERAYAYCFHLIEHFQRNGVPATHEAFMLACDEYEKTFREGENNQLTAEELDGAESLAWKVLLVGWTRAIEGHKDSLYIEVTRPQEKAEARRDA